MIDQVLCANYCSKNLALDRDEGLNKSKSSMQKHQVQRQANKHIKTKRTEATSQIATQLRSILTENRNRQHKPTKP